MSELSELGHKYGTDKFYHHGYHFYYPLFLQNIRDERFNMLEIGYGDGASMKVWYEYFKNANIFISDINVEMVVDNRCKVIKSNQSNQNDLEYLTKIVQSAKFIIDDGSHNPKHQFDTFMYLFNNLLEDGGIYIIEDIETNYWKSDATCYGYPIGDFNLIYNLQQYVHAINGEFSNIKNELNISTITYAQNCIIITKRSKVETNHFNREYRFKENL